MIKFSAKPIDFALQIWRTFNLGGSSHSARGQTGYRLVRHRRRCGGKGSRGVKSSNRLLQSLGQLIETLRLGKYHILEWLTGKQIVYLAGAKSIDLVAIVLS